MRRLGILLAVLIAAPAHGAFPQDPPNDPDFDKAESSCATQSVNDEQHYLYAGKSACAPAAEQPEGSAGMSVDKAWRQTTAGRPDVTVAYVEAGINWHLASSKDLVIQVYLNASELPASTAAPSRRPASASREARAPRASLPSTTAATVRLRFALAAAKGLAP